MTISNHYLTNLSAQSIGRLVSIAGNFIVFLLVARELGAEQFGQYSYILVYLGLAVLIAEFGTNTVLAKQIVEFKNEDEVYWGNFLIFRIASSLIASVLVVIAAYYLRNDLFDSLSVGSLFLFFLASRFFGPIYQVYDKPWYSLYPILVYSVLYTVISIYVLYRYKSIYYLIIVYVGTNVVYTLYAFYLSNKLIRPAFVYSNKHMRKLINLAIPSGLASLLILVHTRADVFMLAYMKSDYEVGIYNAAYKFLDMATILAVMLSSPILPIFARYALDDMEALRNKFKDVTEIIGIATLPVAIIAPVLSPWLIGVFFGDEFAGSIAVLNIMAWIGVITFFSVFFSIVLMAVEKIHFMIWLSAAAAIMNVSLNYFLIPGYSYIGSAWATLVVELILVSVSIYYVHSVLTQIFRWKIWLKIGLANLCMSLSILAMPTSNFVVSTCISMAIYIICLFLFKLPPFPYIGIVRKQKEEFNR